MNDFTDNVRKAFELYLLGNKTEAFNHLIPGSKYHSYLTILDTIKKEKHKLTKETRKMIETFVKNYSGTNEADKIAIREAFLLYDGAAKEDDRQQYLNLILGKIGYFTGHTKPMDLVRKLQKKDKGSKSLNQGRALYDGLFSTKAMIQNCESRAYNVQNYLHKSLYNQMDFKKITDEEFLGFIRSVSNLSDITSKSFMDKFASALDQQYKNYQWYQFENYICDKLTIEQMEILEKKVIQLKSDENWIGKMFEKRFHYELDNEYKETFTLEERREQLIKMYEYSKNRPQSLQTSLLLEILENGMKLDIYDKKYFLEYLKNPLKTWLLNTDICKRENFSYTWSQYMPNIQNRASGQCDMSKDQKMYQIYLEQFYKDKGDVKEFEKYFEKSFLKNLIDEFDFYAGNDPAAADVINAERFETLKDKVIIDLLDCNREVFKREERVQIVAELKNTPQLYVKIYEFDRKCEFSGCSAEYYEKNLTPFRTDINLEGLKTENEKVYEFEELPQKKFRNVFDFPELDNRVGLFIIEFISNGYSSRAVIKKGSLSLLVRSTVAGHVGYVLDENREICKGENAGLWFQNKFYKANPEKNGRIIIPYEPTPATGKAILVNNGFAQLAEFSRQTENYSLNVAYFVLNETILMGNEAKILLRPMLKVNERVCTLKALKNIVIKVTTMSYIDRIPITKIFEDLQIDDKNEVVLTFQVPPNLESISINFEAKVRNISMKQLITLTNSHTITMKTNSTNFSYYEDYLRKYKGDYYYYVLGKNGEPIEDLNVNIGLTHALMSNNPSSISSITDEEGKVNIGQCIDIIKVSTNFQGTQGYCSSEWKLPQKVETCCYPSTINVLEDEPIEIPFPCTSLTQDNFSLVRYNSDGKVIENLYSKATFEEDKEFNTSLVVINDLQFGHYKVELKEIGVIIDLTVHKGVYWETDNFILKEHMIVEKRDRTNFIRISKPMILVNDEETKSKINAKEEKDEEEVKSENKKTKLKFRIKGHKANSRVHVYGLTFLPTVPFSDYESHGSISNPNATLDIFEFAKWKNVYMSNRELGDEYRYVFERKFLERYIGNTLDRPQLVLKRNKIKDTQFDQESISTGGNYSSYATESYSKIECQRPAYLPTSNVAPLYKQQVARSSFSNLAPIARTSTFSYSPFSVNYTPPTIYKSFLNFLERSAFIAENLYPDADGFIEIDFEADKYSTLIITAIDDLTCTSGLFELFSSKSEINKRDLSLTNPLDVEKFYNEVRISENYKKGEKLRIEDITSTDYIIIDSLDKVKRVQDEIRKVFGLGNSSTDLLFLLKWNELSDEEKNKKYNKYICHETNLFIYFKDKEYFNKVVQPFIQNKMEKSFVDYYLLGEYEELKEYTRVETFNKLNPFEKCLLIESIIKKDKKTAIKLTERLKIQAEADQNQNEDTLNKIFDTVLNLNMLQKTSQLDLSNLKSENDFEFSHMQDITQNFPPSGFGSLNQPSSIINNSLFGGGFGGGTTAIGGGLFGGIQPQSQSLFGGIQQQTTGALFGSAPQNQFNNSYAFGAQNLFNVQNQVADNYNNFNENQYNDYGGLYQQNYVNDYNSPFGSLGDQFQIRKSLPSQFQPLEQAAEYCEMDYFGNNQFTSTHIFSQYKFWSDLAEHIIMTGSIEGFQSSSFMFAYNKTTEMVCSWTVLDLDYTSKNHSIRSIGGKGIAVLAASNLVVFKKEIKEAKSELDNNILVIHRFFESGKKNSEEKVKEYLTHQIYGCEVIITNVSSKNQIFQVLWQVPEGSLPVYTTNYQKSENKSLNAYSTMTFEFYFYFPKEGNFIQFPSNITINDKVIAVANKCKFKVCVERQADSFETFKDILISGDLDKIFEFLSTANLLKREKGFNFNDMLWLLADKNTYLKVVEILRERRIFESSVWDYSYHHKDIESIKEAIFQNENFMTRIGTFFETSLVKCSTQITKFRHLDYFPLVNARAHSVGKNASAGLLNVQFRSTYYRFLYTMVEKDEFSTSDWLQFAYYLLLQDRIKEVIQIMTGESKDTSSTSITKISQKINPKDIKEGSPMKLQYDYMIAYLDFFTGLNTGFKVARSIAKQYEEYPVISWRVLFTEILDQLNEYDGIEEPEYEIDQEDEEKKKQNLKKSKMLEPYLECEIDGKQISVEYANITKIKIKYYVIDLEVLFSRAPFLMQSNEDLANAKPIKVEEYTLESNLKSCNFDIAEEFYEQNVMIEVHGESKQQFLTYYSNSMKVHIIDDFGELKVTDREDKILPKVYIKVIAQHSNGTTKFFKDGYTDIRGKFEYAQINSKSISGIQKFAILILSDSHGALTKEARTPRQSEVKIDEDMAFMKPQQYNRWCARNK